MSSGEHDMDLLTTEEIAKILKVEPRTVRDYMDRGELPYIKLRREYRAYRKDVDKFLRDRYNPGSGSTNK
jgi:excisionase family DNA binding protein